MRFRRVIVVFNPRSSKFLKVQEEVLSPLRERKGVIIGKFEVEPTDVDENAARLARILADGDLVITAGGDGTATIGLNGVILSEKDVRFAVLPYGNLNDTARLLGCRNIEDVFAGKPRKVYPLVSEVNGEIWRYAACYFTAGMLATSAEVMDKPSVRKKLQKGNKGTFYSIWTAFLWWRKNRRKEFLFGRGGRVKTDEAERSGVVSSGGGVTLGRATDLIAMNGRTMAKILRGDGNLAFEKEHFWVSTQRLDGFFRVCWFAMRGIFGKMPGKLAKEVEISGAGRKVMIQAEGEYARKEMRNFRIYKSEKAVMMITRRKNG